MRGRDPFKGILSRREPGRARVSTNAGPTADQTVQRSSAYEAAGRGVSNWCRCAALFREVAPAGSRQATCPMVASEREGVRAILRSCGATMVAVERRVLRRKRVRGELHVLLGRLGARAVRHWHTSGALNLKEACGKAIAARSRVGSIVGCAFVASTRPAVRTQRLSHAAGARGSAAQSWSVLDRRAK